MQGYSKSCLWMLVRRCWGWWIKFTLFGNFPIEIFKPSRSTIKTFSLFLRNSVLPACCSHGWLGLRLPSRHQDYFPLGIHREGKKGPMSSVRNISVGDSAIAASFESRIRRLQDLEFVLIGKNSPKDVIKEVCVQNKWSTLDARSRYSLKARQQKRSDWNKEWLDWAE